ncbi:MAG TPA: MucR family transcriptional regulator [Modestobacter sp.]|nr:MucR family transcriptional regulator [Modestobacter sp.]
MIHPVGPLPAAVYWRRRLLVLGGTLGVLAGGGWLGTAVATGNQQQPDTVAAGPTTGAPAPTPALEQVLPSLAAVQVPTPAPTAPPVDVVPSEPAAPAPGPVSGGPCSDDMIAVDVRPDPSSTPAGSKPTFNLVITNVSPVACVRLLDKGLQEILLLDATGSRVWGSNDCFPEASSDVRTLQPGESAVFPVLWSGLSSGPDCVGDRSTPGAGSYVLRGRLDTKPSPDVPFALT